MAEHGQAQRIVYGDAEAEYAGLPFTLTHWTVARTSRKSADGVSIGRDLSYDLTGYVAADDAEDLALAYADALAILTSDGGDLRISYAKGDSTWRVIDELISARTTTGTSVSSRIEPVGGYRLAVQLTVTASTAREPGEGEEGEDGIASETFHYTFVYPPGAPSSMSVTGEQAGAPPFQAREAFLGDTLPVLRTQVPFDDYQERVRFEEFNDGASGRFDVEFTELFEPFPAGIEDGERDSSEARDEHFRVTVTDSGSYAGPRADAWLTEHMQGLSPGWDRLEWTRHKHKTEAVQWRVQRSAGTGEKVFCVEWHESITNQSSPGIVLVKEYQSTSPLLFAPVSAPALRWTQSGYAVSDDPRMILRAPELVIPGAETAPREVVFARDDRNHVVTRWRYETASVTPSHNGMHVRPHERDEMADLATVDGMKVTGVF